LNENFKKKIIETFICNVKGKIIEINKKHCGSEGHWLEEKMGIKHNCKNEPDIFGYEMKKNSSKITFGDFSASEYLFSKKKETIENINSWGKNINCITRSEFIKYFGTPNPLKNNRYSWSGNCVPKYGEYNDSGQMLKFNDNLDLCVFFFDKDKRETKFLLPEFIKNVEQPIIIVLWKKEKLERHINNKYNKNGFFICKKLNNKYEKICFGGKFNYLHFVENVKNKNIIFDSGMYMGNSRNYSHFRSSTNNFWNLLIIDEY
jgi:hypothetical protein